MPKFSLEKIVNIPRDVVFSVLSNYEEYQKLLPQHFPSIRIRSVRENTAVVEEHMFLGSLELVMMAKHVSEEPVLHDVYIIGGDAKGSHFRQQFIETSKGTKIIAEVNLKLNGTMKISTLFGKNNFQEAYSKVLDDFVKVCNL